MANRKLAVKSWLGILSVLWLAFLAAAVVYIIIAATAQPDVAAEEEVIAEEVAEEEPPPEEEAVEEEPEVEEEPDANGASLEITVEPEDVTVHVIGPEGYSEQFSGGETLTGLAPGLYVIVVVKDRQSATAEVVLEAREMHTVSLALEEIREEPDAEETQDAGEEPGEEPEEEPEEGARA